MNSTAKHTPGPWKKSANEIIGAEGTPNAMVICILSSGHTSPAQPFNYLGRHFDSLASKVTANAHLIAAAPDLLALANRVVEIFQPMQDKGQNGRTFECLLNRAKDCVAKATTPNGTK